MLKFTNFAYWVIIITFITSSLTAQEKDFKFTAKNRIVNNSNNNEATSLPSYINESFEKEFPPAGWTKYDLYDGSGWNQQAVGTTPIPGWIGGYITPTPDGRGGNKMAFCNYDTGGIVKNDQWLITPQITNILPNSFLFFWLRKFSVSYADTIKINISTTDNQPTSFTNLLTLNFAYADSGWKKYVIDLNPYNDRNIYIAFQEVVSDNFNDGDAIFLDLVQITDDYTSVELEEADFPDSYSLKQNYPNPFNPSTNINFNLPYSGFVHLWFTIF